MKVKSIVLNCIFTKLKSFFSVVTFFLFIIIWKFFPLQNITCFTFKMVLLDGWFTLPQVHISVGYSGPWSLIWYIAVIIAKVLPINKILYSFLLMFEHYRISQIRCFVFHRAVTGGPILLLYFDGLVREGRHGDFLWECIVWLVCLMSFNWGRLWSMT